MGQVTILEHTTKNPIQMIGEMAGVCYRADTSKKEKNYQRGLDCLNNNHGRTFEFPDVYMVLDGYSARVIRELYTHIGGSPTRLQASTRYINYQKGFDYVVPPSIEVDETTLNIYHVAMADILNALQTLESLDIPREDSAMLLPLGMSTTVSCRYNFRTLFDMSHQRECMRAYWEFRDMFNDIKKALGEYSFEWKFLVDNYFQPKCEFFGKCPESNSCGKID